MGLSWVLVGAAFLALLARSAVARPSEPPPPGSRRKVAATRADWKTEPARALRDLPFERQFTPRERAWLTWGTVPWEMEDKWFVFMEGDTLFFHRSWTGHLTYQVELRPNQGGWCVARAQVCADSSIYRSLGDKADARTLSGLITSLVRGQFP